MMDRRQQGPDRPARSSSAIGSSYCSQSPDVPITCGVAGGGGQSPSTTVGPTPSPVAPTTIQGTPSSITSDGSAKATITATPATAVSSGSSNGVSKGAVAGIAIGTAIVGAAIAFLVAFLMFKRRKRNLPALSQYESNPELMALQKEPTPYVQPLTNFPTPNGAAAAVGRRDVDLTNLSNSSDFLAGVLPRAADDATVKQKVSLLFSQIQQHVDTFYRDVHASITPTMENDLARFGTGDVGMVDLLQSSSQPTFAIKHALTGYVLSVTSPETEQEATLFPTEVAGVGDKELFTGTGDLSTAYVLYKRLAVHLHSSISANAHSRISEIREASEHFALAFFPWANPGYNDQEKDEDLVQIISNAVDLMIWLHGQPFVYDFKWEGVGQRGTVISPALMKLTDSRGRATGQAQSVVEPFVVSL